MNNAHIEARRGGLPNGMCSKGWGQRCAHSKTRRCRCACGGANHGKGITRALGTSLAPASQHEAHFRIETFMPERIVIRDLGHFDGHISVTNDAEGVIKKLSPAPMQRVFYYDSEGRLDELVHANGVFVRFAPGSLTNDGLPRVVEVGGQRVEIGDLVEL